MPTWIYFFIVVLSLYFFYFKKQLPLWVNTGICGLAAEGGQWNKYLSENNYHNILFDRVKVSIPMSYLHLILLYSSISYHDFWAIREFCSVLIWFLKQGIIDILCNRDLPAQISNPVQAEISLQGYQYFMDSIFNLQNIF